MASGFFVIIVTETRHRGHVILILALGPSFVHHILIGVLLDILCMGPAKSAHSAPFIPASNSSSGKLRTFDFCVITLWLPNQ